MDQRVPLWTPEGRSGTAEPTPSAAHGALPRTPSARRKIYATARLHHRNFSGSQRASLLAGRAYARLPTSARRYGGSAPTTPEPSKCLYGISHILHSEEQGK